MVSFEEFLKRASEKHGDKYSYDETTFKGMHHKMRIICPIHGEFFQVPKDHLNTVYACKKCSVIERSIKRQSNTTEFIEKARRVHGDKYDYSKVEYVNNSTKVCIICKEHGEFWQTPNNHLIGQGCPRCTKNYNFTTSEFVKRCVEIHGNKYDYSLVDYKSMKEKIRIICNEHGEFLQDAWAHVNGCGCPKCNSSHLENEIRNFLIKNNITFEEQKHFEWLGRQTYDFYLPQHKIAIECQGIQHFEPREKFGGKEAYDKLVAGDGIKLEKSNENDVKLLYYSNLHIDYPYKVYENKEEILEIINSYGSEKKVDSRTREGN